LLGTTLDKVHATGLRYEIAYADKDRGILGKPAPAWALTVFAKNNPKIPAVTTLYVPFFGHEARWKIRTQNVVVDVISGVLHYSTFFGNALGTTEAELLQGVSTETFTIPGVNTKPVRASILLHEMSHTGNSTDGSVKQLNEEEAQILDNTYLKLEHKWPAWSGPPDLKPAKWDTNWKEIAEKKGLLDWKQWVRK
jgi:hypothetical protein